MDTRPTAGTRSTPTPARGAPVRARAPLRLGLAGGGTDVSPYADRHGGAVMNATIDRFVYCSLSWRDDEQVVLESVDLARSVSYPATGPLPIDGRLGARLLLHAGGRGVAGLHRAAVTAAWRI